MPNRLAGVLESYDFFGKSIPGIILLLGLVTLLPEIPLIPGTQGGETLRFEVLVTLALALVFSGLVLGQGVHSVAVNIEKFLYRIGHWILNRYYVKAPLVFSEDQREQFPRIDGVINYITPWLARRYWGINDIFKSHRRLFENEIGWHFDPSETKRKSDVSNVNYQTFRQSCIDEYDIDIALFENTTDKRLLVGSYEELRHLYPMITSRISGGPGRASGFQARYSFCRGMWVVLLIIFLGYVDALYIPFLLDFLGYEPAIFDLLSRHRIEQVTWALWIPIVVFMDAAGDYKRHYIEYLVADFNAMVVDRNKQQRDKQSPEEGSNKRT